VSGMVFRSRRGPKQVQLNVTSLVDVLFLLLIFFMLTGTFKRVGELELRLPESSTATPVADHPPREVELILTEDGRLLLGDERIEMPELKVRLQRILEEDPESQVTIKAEESVTHGQVIRLMDVVREAGFHGLGIGTRIGGQ
jgi:biopolymer transport protein ExbD